LALTTGVDDLLDDAEDGPLWFDTTDDSLLEDGGEESLMLDIGFALTARANVNMTNTLNLVDEKEIFILRVF